ncbi:ATP-binding protein [Aestuariivita boseongensis]|uniref:ATP-binding protein n=1 Tax=Aestuariivita boseongensis TaxID=1470562 RepID=UPI00067FE1E9|nr:ATP-binding protein [Aestuariivita boseongensis]
MGDTSGDGADALTQAKARYSRKELLIRYARGRVAYVWMRVSMIALGVAILWFADGPGYALPALALAILGEGVDCLYLKRVARRDLRSDADVHRAYVVSTITGTVQALTISVCVALAWFGPVGHSAPLFALSFLVGTTINAGLVMPYHRAASISRVIVYGIALVVLLGSEVILYGAITHSFALNLGGSIMLLYMAYAYVSFVNTGFSKNRKRTLDMTRREGELQQLNAQLIDRERELSLLSLVARHANDSMIISKADATVSFVNDAFIRTTGYTSEEIVGRRLRDVLTFEKTDRAVLQQIIQSPPNGSPFRGEIELRRKDGTPFWFEVNQVPVLDGDGSLHAIVSVNRDATLAKKQKAELIAAQQASENSARAKAEFLATMSHEIRTPMNGIMGMAELLVDTDLKGDQRLYADTIRGSAQGLLSIINDILDLSKLDADKMTLMPVDFDLRCCLENTIHLLRPQAESKGVALHFDFPDTAPERVWGDDMRLRQILLNLVGNAIKFTDEGFVRVAVSLAHTEEDVELTVDVEDTGIGIPSDKLMHVFERFSQAEASTTRRFGGTGLGLTISKLLAEAMGGDITVTSTAGEGACFTLTVHLQPAVTQSDVTTPAEAEVTLTDQISGLRVLVAEDNQINRMLMGKYLADADITLTFANNGVEAVAMARDMQPDVIFMDMSMPVMDGLEATRQIRATCPGAPRILALTANALTTDRDACLKAGMDGFLSKPVRRNDILAQLAQHRATVPSD